MNRDSQEFEDLCGVLLDGEATLEERGRLLALLQDKPELIGRLREQLVVSEALRQRERDADAQPDFVRHVIAHVVAVGDEEGDDFPNRIDFELKKSRRRRTSLALAAGLVIAGAGVFFALRTTPAGPPPIAQAIRLDARGTVMEQEEVFPNQKFELNSGILRMEFANGAIVAVESPARFEVLNGMEINLESGTLNAWCPETAHGFQVHSASTTLTDLGTSFGVKATPDGRSEFLVLEGEVEVERADAKRKLESGAALRSTPEAGLEDLAFSAKAFRRTWPVASGILSTGGQVIPAPPGTADELAHLEDNDHVLVIPEKRDFIPETWVQADIRKPGVYEGSTMHNMAGFQPDKPLRSYLIRYNPVGVLALDEFQCFQGSVTFDQPVRAIVTLSSKLTNTDRIFRQTPLPSTAEDPTMRGLEPGQPPNPPDRLILSEDRRTVTILFYAGESIDEIRVLTEAD